MLSFFKKPLRTNALAAVCPDAGGIAVAQIRREKELPPTLEMCAYHAIDSANTEAQLLKELVAKYRLNTVPGVSLMESGKYSMVMVEAPDVPPEELRAAVRWRIRDLIDFHIDDAVIDVFEVPDTKAAGKNRMMYAVVARSAMVKQRIDQMLDAGVRLGIVDIPELALRNISALLPEDVGGVALIYIGADRGLFTITRQGTIYLSRRLERGLHSIPATPTAGADRDLIEGWLDGIIVEIQRSLDYYERHFSLPPVSSIIIAPLERPVPGIAEYIGEQTDISTRMLDMNSMIDSEVPLEFEMQAHCLLAIGAALRQESRAL